MDRGQRLPTAWLRPLGSGRGRSWCREGDDRERSLVLNLSVLLSHSEVWRVRVIGEDYTQPPSGDRFSDEDKSPTASGTGCSVPSYDRALHALRTWLDSWAGIGHVAVGMHRQGRPATGSIGPAERDRRFSSPVRR